MNCVRKHLSRVKGGRLAEAFRGKRMLSLIISDVVGDPLDVIASGPTAPDPTTFAQCARRAASLWPPRSGSRVGCKPPGARRGRGHPRDAKSTRSTHRKPDHRQQSAGPGGSGIKGPSARIPRLECGLGHRG